MTNLNAVANTLPPGDVLLIVVRNTGCHIASIPATSATPSAVVAAARRAADELLNPQPIPKDRTRA